MRYRYRISEVGTTTRAVRPLTGDGAAVTRFPCQIANAASGAIVPLLLGKSTPAQLTDETAALGQVVARLRNQFPELPGEEIQRAVHRRYSGFDGGPIRDFVPILVERSAREDLKTFNGSHRA